MSKQDEQITNLRIALADFQAHPRNYNEHPEAQIAELAESLKLFGQPKPVVVWKGYIVAGHGVFLAAQRLKWAELDARRLPDGWPEYKVTAYLAADNELARGASPNLLGLAQLAQEIRQEDEAMARLAAGGEDGLRRLAELVAGPLEGMIPDGERYQEQYGVIVVCANEAEQEACYNDLAGRYDNVRVVVT